jgi:hypothetical protein
VQVKYESGMDDSPMCDDATYDSRTHTMNLNDVALDSPANVNPLTRCWNVCRTLSRRGDVVGCCWKWRKATETTADR